MGQDGTLYTGSDNVFSDIVSDHTFLLTHDTGSAKECYL